jgi:membrane-associated phospholipid phosphatase
MARLRPYALVAVLAALWLGMLLLGGPASEADPALLKLFRVPALVPAAQAFTLLGNWDILLPLTLAGALLLFFLVSRRSALVYMLLILSGRLIVELEKAAIGRQRPDVTGRLAHVSTLSYPSGHSAYSMMAWLGLALLAAGATRWRAPAVAAGLALAFFVGLSRLILQVHWPSDVIGGWAFGAAWTLLLVRLAGTQGGDPALIPPTRRRS